MSAAGQFSGPWLPWFHGDFIKATQGWTVTERGVYFLLLGASWEMGPLPDDRRRLAGIVGAQLDEFDDAWKTVRPKFILTEQGLINRRLESHRDKQALRSEKARQSALSRKRPKAENDQTEPHKGDLYANAERTLSERIENASEKQVNTDANPMLEGMRSGCSSELRSQILEFQNTEPKRRRERCAAGAPPAFHQQIIDAYHELCPELPQVKIWTAKRRGALDARMAERVTAGKPADTVDYWRSLFAEVAASDFLCGRTKDPFTGASLEWMLRPENFAKVIERNYSNRKPNGAHAHG
jgi:uncharacterized protein YdaU (DUF1376 family)